MLPLAVICRRFYGTPRDSTARSGFSTSTMEGKEGRDSESSSSGAGHLPAAAAAASSSGAEVDDDELTRRMQAARAGRGRRGVVFSEPVKLDASWRPTVVEKTEEERAGIEAVIVRNALLGGLDEDGRAVVVGAMARKTFESGDVIIKQGDMGDYYYIIAGGERMGGRERREGRRGGRREDGQSRRGPATSPQDSRRTPCVLAETGPHT
jgi:hypothetical protein